jgi:hypothetical protein
MSSGRGLAMSSGLPFGAQERVREIAIVNLLAVVRRLRQEVASEQRVGLRHYGLIRRG